MAEYPIIMKQKNNQGQYDTLYPQTLGSQIQGNIQSSQIEGDIPSSQITGNIPSSQITGQFPASQINDIFTKDQILTQSVAQLFGLSSINAIPDNVFEILSQAALYKTVVPTAQLSTLPEGSIIYLNENGDPVPFYVAKQGYEPNYNTNRVLVVRKDGIQQGLWNSAVNNTYVGSTLDTWLNSEYLNLLDAEVKTSIGTTNIEVAAGYSTFNLSRTNKSIFALSANELGIYSSSYTTNEGNTLDISSILKICVSSGKTVNQWIRSPAISYNNRACTSNFNGELNTEGVTGLNYYRPAFTLPSSFIVTFPDRHGLYDVSDNLLLKLPGVQIETGSYIGTGTYGRNNKNSLTFEFAPKIVFLTQGNSFSNFGFFVFGASQFCTINNIGGSFTITENTLSWYSDESATYQFNSNAQQFYYIALG